MSLKFIPLQPDHVFNFNDVTQVRIYAKITVFMPFYDFIVKFQKLDLVDLSALYWKKDESQIDSDGLKMSI